MTTTIRLLIGGLLPAVCLTMFAAPARAIIVVYDLKLDFSNANNPSGTWAYYQGNTLLTHYTPVPTPLSAAVANGYWGVGPTNLNSSIMRATANGSTAPGWTDNDFLAGDMLVRTTDPSTGGPVNITWTAPSNGYFTYSGEIWYANPQAGPFGNDFLLSLNAGPAMESGSASLGQDLPNGVSFVNGLLPTNVLAGDVLKLQLSPTVLSPVGTLAGVNFVIDFVPAPEPATGMLLAIGGAALLMWGWRRKR